MGEKLTKLYNTMAQIETKGDSTKLMASCLNFLSSLIAEASVPENNNEASDAT